MRSIYASDLRIYINKEKIHKNVYFLLFNELRITINFWEATLKINIVYLLIYDSFPYF